MSMTHDEMIAVIAHHRNGGKVEMKPKGDYEWQNANGIVWNFGIMDYRAKPEPLVLWAEIMPDGRHIQSSLNQFKPTNGGTLKKFIEEL